MKTATPEPEPFKGAKDLERRGEDVNADLEMDDRASRTEAAVALRIAGATYSQIARTLGYSTPYVARNAVERALANLADSPEERDKQRVLHGRRLDRLLQSVMGKAVDPRDPEHLAYNARALAILDRHSRLYGLDAPVQHDITYSPKAEEIDKYVAKFVTLAIADTHAAEADIMDADIVEGDE